MTEDKKKSNLKKKKAKEHNARYGFFMNLTRFLLYPVIKFGYRAKITKFNGLKNRNFLILFNHQTPFDQFFILSAFKGVVRLIATEDVVSNGKISHFLNYAFGLIPIKKQASDVKAVMKCVKIAENGGTIALSPEGNRTYSGETCSINPAIASFIKLLKLPVVFFEIRGGYGVQPRWSDTRRKGKMTCKVKRVMEYDEYKDMSKERLLDVVKSELYVDESDDGEEFYSKKSAEKLERLLYVCPYCGFSEFKSRNDTVTCKTCGREAKYNANKTFTGDFPFKNVLKWYKFQEKFVSEYDFNAAADIPVFSDRANVYTVIPYERKVPLFKNAEIYLYTDRILIKSEGKELVLPFTSVGAATVLGRNKLNVYIKDKIYQIKGGKSFNAIKYVHFKNIYTQKVGGKQNEFFFGI